MGHTGKIDIRELCPSVPESMRWVDEVKANPLTEGGPLITVIYVGVSKEEDRRIKERLIDLGNRIKYRVEHGLPPD